MLGRKKWLSIVTVSALAVAGLATTAGADAASESGFLTKINTERAAHGLGALAIEGNLVAHARNHTQAMIDADKIYHSNFTPAGGTGWSAMAENVGRGGTVDSLHKAFMDSSGHRQNVLGDFNYVGIGTDYSPDGRLYVTVVFMKKGGSTTTQPSPTTTAPKPPTAPQPTTTTTTTLPPTTTTTTLIVGPDKAITPGESCLSVTRLWWTCHD